jgi:hypothetical protein
MGIQIGSRSSSARVAEWQTRQVEGLVTLIGRGGSSPLPSTKHEILPVQASILQHTMPLAAQQNAASPQILTFCPVMNKVVSPGVEVMIAGELAGCGSG